MAELKHRLFWIKKFQEGLESVRINSEDPTYEEFYLRYYNFRNDETSRQACHDVLSSMAKDGIIKKIPFFGKGGTHVYERVKPENDTV